MVRIRCIVGVWISWDGRRGALCFGEGSLATGFVRCKDYFGYPRVGLYSDYLYIKKLGRRLLYYLTRDAEALSRGLAFAEALDLECLMPFEPAMACFADPLTVFSPMGFSPFCVDIA